jgi:hypothetical protein
MGAPPWGDEAHFSGNSSPELGGGGALELNSEHFEVGERARTDRMRKGSRRPGLCKLRVRDHEIKINNYLGSFVKNAYLAQV